jgi:hypothetical protein
MFLSAACLSAVGGLYVAFNSGHTPKVVELPHWHGRAWKVVVDTGKLAPYDILIPDAELAPEEAEQVRTAAGRSNACYVTCNIGSNILIPDAELAPEEAEQVRTAAGRS